MNIYARPPYGPKWQIEDHDFGGNMLDEAREATGNPHLVAVREREQTQVAAYIDPIRGIGILREVGVTRPRWAEGAPNWQKEKPDGSGERP